MDSEKVDKVILHKKQTTKLEHLEITANSINHGLIAITTFYIIWYCFHDGFDQYQHYHTFFSTIGYQFFMSEGIMAMYSKNSYTMSVGNRQAKVWIHLVLQVIGGGFALIAIPYQYVKREQMGRRHFGNSHGIVGEKT